MEEKFFTNGHYNTVILFHLLKKLENSELNYSNLSKNLMFSLAACFSVIDIFVVEKETNSPDKVVAAFVTCPILVEHHEIKWRHKLTRTSR